MEEGDDYELMPHGEILELKKELKKLKEGSPQGGMQLSMEKLSANIQELLAILRQAADDIKSEEHGPVMDRLNSLSSRIDELKEQNSKIAEAILAVADMIKEGHHEESKPLPPPEMPEPDFGTELPFGAPPGMEPAPRAAPSPLRAVGPQPIAPPPMGRPIAPMAPPMPMGQPAQKRGLFRR